VAAEAADAQRGTGRDAEIPQAATGLGVTTGRIMLQAFQRVAFQPRGVREPMLGHDAAITTSHAASLHMRSMR
jgi:hypothetical protein